MCVQQQPPLGRIQKKKWRDNLTIADEEEMTLDLNMVQVGRLVSDGAFNLEVSWIKFAPSVHVYVVLLFVDQE